MKKSLHHFLLFLAACILLPCPVHALDAALFIPRSDAFWTTFASYTQTASNSIGLNIEVHDAKENPETMLNQADRVCRQGIDAIIFMNFQGIGESILQIAEKYKTPAFLVNTSFKVNTFAPRGKYPHWIGELTANDKQAGTLLARRLAEIAEKKGIKALNIFAFQGREKDIASILRMEGLKTFIVATDNAELVATEPANWDREQAKAIFRRVLLSHPQINVVWAANDRMAQGAAEAVRELEIEKPMVYGGINWGLDALRALDRGVIDIDVGGHIFDGALAAIMVFDYLNGYDFANEKMRFTSNMVTITRNNINKFNAIFVRPGMIDFRSLSKTHNPKRLQYNFDLNSIADRVEPAQASLTPEELEWIHQHPKIKVGNETDLPPFDFVENGKAMGYAIDFLRLAGKKMGLSFEFINGYSWDELMTLLRREEIHVLPVIAKTPNRIDFMEFTSSYMDAATAIATRANEKTIKEISDLKGKRLAVVKGYHYEESVIRTHPKVMIIQVNGFLEGLEAVLRDRADAFMGNEAVINYTVRQHFLSGLKVTDRTGMEDMDIFKFHMGVAKRQKVLASILDKGIQAVSSDEKQALFDRWINFRPLPERDSSPLQFTEKEQDFLNSHPIIRVGIMDAWPPFDFIDEKGRPSGIDVSYITALNRRLNNILKIVPGAWTHIYNGVKDRKLDVLMDITPKLSREDFFNFTTPYLTVPHVIVAPQNTPFLNNEADLQGKTLALEQGFGNVNYFRDHYPRVNIKEYRDTAFALDAVARGEADAYAGNRAVALYLLAKEIITNLKVHGRLEKEGSILAMGTRKDWPILRDILQKALDDISQEEKNDMVGRWVGVDQKGQKIPTMDLTPEEKLQFTARERAFIKEHPVLRLGYDIDWYPMEFSDNHGQFSGIAADYITRIEKLLGIQIKPLPPKSWQEMVKTAKAGELEILPSLVKTPQREQYLNFTTPYLNFPMVIVTREETPYLSDMSGLRDQKIAVVSGYVSHERLRDRHPELDLMPVTNVREGLMAVNRKKAFAFVGNMATISHILSQEGLSRLKISGETPYSYHLSMGIRKDLPVLTGLMQKALDAITQEERSDISRKWFSITYKRVIDYTLMWKVLAGALLIFLVIFFWNRKLSRLNHQLALAQKSEHQALISAESSNEKLLKANDRLKELDRLKSMFIASMSHELRTPLNSIIGFSGLMIQGISGTLSKEQKDNLNRIHKAGIHLLALISDVIDISKIEAGRIDVFPEEFSIKDLVEEAVATIKPQADAKGLTLSVETDTWPMMRTDYKRLLQCLLNFLGNAVKYSEKGEITLSLFKNLTDIEIRVQDTGIGIAPKDLPRLFNAFERLESRLRIKAGGTGLGLYLTKKIATELLQGTVRVESKIDEGSIFYLKIPTDLNTEVDK